MGCASDSFIPTSHSEMPISSDIFKSPYMPLLSRCSFHSLSRIPSQQLGRIQNVEEMNLYLKSCGQGGIHMYHLTLTSHYANQPCGHTCMKGCAWICRSGQSATAQLQPCSMDREACVWVVDCLCLTGGQMKGSRTGIQSGLDRELSHEHGDVI